MKFLDHETLELYGTYCPDIVLTSPAQITIQITVYQENLASIKFGESVFQKELANF